MIIYVDGEQVDVDVVDIYEPFKEEEEKEDSPFQRE